MPFLKKVAKAVAGKSPAGKAFGSGMIGKLMQNPNVQKGLSDAAAKATAPKAVSKAKPMVGGFLGKAVGNAMQGTGVASPNAKKGKGPMGGLIGKALKARGFENGGKVDKAGRALGKKTPDAMGRAMAKAPMKKNMGGMAKKSSKKC
jgi:hypothetical protein